MMSLLAVAARFVRTPLLVDAAAAGSSLDICRGSVDAASPSRGLVIVLFMAISVSSAISSAALVAVALLPTLAPALMPLSSDNIAVPLGAKPIICPAAVVNTEWLL